MVEELYPKGLVEKSQKCLARRLNLAQSSRHSGGIQVATWVSLRSSGGEVTMTTL